MTEADRKSPWAAALGRIVSGLFIVTARHETHGETGMLASWVMQCGFEPPLITLVIRKGRPLADWLRAGTPFLVNILDTDQKDLIGHFGRGFNVGEDAFEGVPIERITAGVVLTESLGYLECQSESSVLTGDHELFVARVIGGRMLEEAQPMVHVRKNGLHY